MVLYVYEIATVYTLFSLDLMDERCGLDFDITWWLRPCALADYCVWFVASTCVAVKDKR